MKLQRDLKFSVRKNDPMRQFEARRDVLPIEVGQNY